MTTNIMKQALKRLSLQEKASDVKSRLARIEANLSKAAKAAVAEAPSEEEQRAAASEVGGEEVEIYSWVCSWTPSLKSLLADAEESCVEWVELENAYRSCLTTADKKLLGESEVLSCTECACACACACAALSIIIIASPLHLIMCFISLMILSLSADGVSERAR
jgi:hypothetical protein